ncbi:MAG: YjjG family noncanonical pyrimidine nucleotidase, partial [Dysgonamonadaceae bacterium]|nr:YjjG family noncanonical pyrimidine nucleotidase [Dysgonamonadaceae bacterium]
STKRILGLQSHFKKSTLDNQAIAFINSWKFFAFSVFWGKNAQLGVREFGINDPAYAKKLSDDFLERTTFKTNLVDGTMELLEYLKPKYNMHILSNGFREVQYKKINNSGLKPYFDKVILSDDAGINKPHPDIFTYALKNTHSLRDETLVIGDSWDADILGAYNSGIHQLWFNPEELHPKGFIPTYCVKTLNEIKQIL